MTAKNMKELEAMLMKQLRKAMDNASYELLGDMYKETGKFYTRGKPKLYTRTGALGDSPKVTQLKVVNNTISFDAYLDQTHNYTTGTFTMPQVLERAESTHFRSGILGKPKFWEDSEKRMKSSFRKCIKKYFK